MSGTVSRLWPTYAILPPISSKPELGGRPLLRDGRLRALLWMRVELGPRRFDQNRSSDFEDALDLDRGVARQHGDADRCARVPALVAEHRHHQVGGAVHDLGAVEKRGRGIDEATEANHLLDLVEVAERGLDLRQHVDRAGARCLLAVL